MLVFLFLFSLFRCPPTSTRTATLWPYSTRFRAVRRGLGRCLRAGRRPLFPEAAVGSAVHAGTGSPHAGAAGRRPRERRGCPGGRAGGTDEKIGRAHVRTPVTNAHIECRLLLDKKKQHKLK